uniref:Intraflagellar transport protein 46 homolog n=1 Tax=Cyprinodon variegatus TaxID=28743 RepID=A0A3Q2E9G9_CYPVA
MERGKEAQLLRNQPYDESLEVEDGEEVPSLYSPAPRGQRQVPRGPKPGASPSQEEEEEEEEEDSEEDDTDEDDDDDDDETTEAVEGAYDPADYANLPVTTEIKELFQYITRYSPQTLELEHCLRPFIPDFIPTAGDIDAFLKVQNHNTQTVSDLYLKPKPCAPSLSLLQLKKVTSVASPHTNPRVVDSWVDSISALHRSKPPASVQYGRPMPDIDSLMQEWPPELEEGLGRLQLPPARLSCDLRQYVDIICSLLDIPVYGSRVHSLHLLFSLYLEFRDSQHFTSRA